MKTIKVVELLGTASFMSYEKGSKLLEIVLEELERNNVVEIDFTGYSYISTSFINNSFGELALRNGWDFKEFEKHIKLVALDEDDTDDVKLAIINANNRSLLINNGINPESFYAHI